MSQANAFIDSAASKRAAPRPAGVRFSLLTLVLGALLLSSIGLLYWSHADLRRLQAENAGLKEKAGVLNIADPSKVHIVRLPIASDCEWRWNFYVPKGKQAVIRATERVESDEKLKPQEIWTSTFSSTESELLAVRIDRHNGQVLIEDSFGFSKLPLPENYAAWLKAGNYSSEMMSAGKTIPINGEITALAVQLLVKDPTATIQILPERSASGFQILIEEHDAPTTK
jgi:hypothetical protein